MFRVSSRVLAIASAVFCTLFAATQPVTATAGPGGYVAPMSAGFMRDVYSLPSDQTYGAFVHFGAGTQTDHSNLLNSFGLKVTADFERYAKAVFAVGTVGAFRSLGSHPSVAYLERNEKLRYFSGTGSWATRVRVAQENVSGGPYKDAGGRILRGQGATIVIVDSGLDAVHPDFAGRVLHNYKIVCPVTPVLVDSATGVCFGAQYVDVGQTDSDTTGGHGTHCAGIATGGGQASTGDYSVPGAAPNVKGTFTGVAPDAKLIAYSVGEGINILFAAEAFQHILDHWDPSIKVVSNSYGNAAGTAFDPAGITAKLDKALVDKGTTIVYAAGNGDTLNNGGVGDDDRTSSSCKDPTPGVICVANYDDGGTGSRTGSLDFSSSRGWKGHPEIYPDIAAPGSFITATCVQPQPGQGVCAEGTETNWQPYYGTISGTSMATPHVAGAVALLAQADPTLTPAQIEALIQRNALKVSTNGAYEADPQNPGSTTNFGFGAGLLDLPAALNAIGTAHGTATASGTEVVIFDGYTTAASADAENVQKLTMQEATVGTTTGIFYRLTVKSYGFAAAPNGVLYQLDQNVDGKQFRTKISATPEGVAKVASASGNASSVTRAANVITFFVPYVQLGSPPVGAPIHNINVSVFDGASPTAPINIVPHPANSTAATQTVQPMYGKPFSTQLAASGSGGGGTSESSCVVPGLTVVTDGMGDNLPPTPGSDMLGLSVALPHAATAADAKLVFTLGTDPSRALQPPGTGWYASFGNPRDNKVYGVRMIYRTISPTFESYLASGSLDAGSGSATDGRFADVTKLADANSNYDPKSGRITIIVPMSDLNVQPGDVIGGFNGGSTLTTNPEDLPTPSGTLMIDPMPDSLGRLGSFTTYNPTDSSVCPVAASPIARLSPTSLVFATQAVATKSAAKTVVYTNTGTTALSINAISMASQDSVSDFVEADDCPKTLAVGASCTISVRFRPLQAGVRTGTMTIIANNGRRSDAVALSGTGM